LKWYVGWLSKDVDDRKNGNNSCLLVDLVWHQSLVFLVIRGHWCISKHELATTVFGMGVIWQPRILTTETSGSLHPCKYPVW
jgi:hypothetical protein